MSKGTGVKGDRATHSMVTPAFHASDIEDGTYTHHKNPGDTDVRYADEPTSDPPTFSEITAVFGEPTEGFLGILNNDGGEIYLVASDGLRWMYLNMIDSEDLSP